MNAASLIVVDPNGRRSRVELQPIPFKIGRHADNHLVIRDSRASRSHAQIALEDGAYVIEDAGSRHGISVNGQRTTRHVLRHSDRIEFGFPDSCQLIFAVDGAEIHRLMEQFAAKPGGNLAKLRAVLEVARALQTSFSIQDVLNAVVDAALAVTGAERGFLLLCTDGDLETRVARSREGAPLPESELRVPRRIIDRALRERRDLFSMRFDPLDGAAEAGHSIADLELRSVVCVPLVRIKAGAGDDTSILSTASDTAGVLYLDSRGVTADLGGGNRELLQTLAIEASTVLENARLLEEQQEKRKIEEELDLARTIQQNLLPKALPSEGWFRASGASVPSHQVGGDYFDILPIDDSRWAAVVTDVSGKGVSAALLASLLQGSFLTIVSDQPAEMEQRMARINRFLTERTGGKYATMFTCLLNREGHLHYVNAGHCAPLLVSPAGRVESLEATAMPVGLLPDAEFQTACKQLAPGDQILIYSDGITDAQNASGEFFGRKRLREIAAANAGRRGCELRQAVLDAVTLFTAEAEQADDMTLLVLEYGAF